MQLAIIADIHGNAPALAAVLDDITRAAPDLIVHLGDACNGPVDPAGTVALLRALKNVRHVRGNGDRMVGAVHEAPTRESVRFARARLAPDDVAWLGDWPQVVEGVGWLACHGSPWNDEEYLLERVTAEGVFLREPSDIAKRLGPTHAGIVFTGHTHVPRLVQLADGRMVVNPGSVGLPAYEDREPFPHRMEAGSPHARYPIAERRARGWHIDLRAVPYDWEGAAQIAEGNGAPAWARALRTGYV